jgi:exodeoxyribonuclease V alpha subunit
MKDATGIEASTIHRLLQWQGHQQVFLYNEDNPLNLDFLIVDEFSMVDIFLFNSLLKALSKKTRILLVGDFDQLPIIEVTWSKLCIHFVSLATRARGVNSSM